MALDGVRKGGRYTYRTPTVEEIAGFMAVSVLDAEGDWRTDKQAAILWLTDLANLLLKKYEITEKLLDGKPITKDNKEIS